MGCCLHGQRSYQVNPLPGTSNADVQVSKLIMMMMMMMSIMMISLISGLPNLETWWPRSIKNFWSHLRSTKFKNLGRPSKFQVFSPQYMLAMWRCYSLWSCHRDKLGHQTQTGNPLEEAKRKRLCSGPLKSLI